MGFTKGILFVPNCMGTEWWGFATMHANVGLLTCRLEAFKKKTTTLKINMAHSWGNVAQVYPERVILTKCVLRRLMLWLNSFDHSALAKEVHGKQVCYKFNFMAKSIVSWCPKHVDVFCHFTNAANNSVRSRSMKLNLVPGESISNYFKALYSWTGIYLFIHSLIHSFNNICWAPSYGMP